jgi:hypothetical protein
VPIFGADLSLPIFGVNIHEQSGPCMCGGNRELNCSSSECANDELICSNNVCMGSECTVDDAGVTSGCTGPANCDNGFC